MQVRPLDIAGAALLETERRGDARGSFARWFCDRELGKVLAGSAIHQINHSFSARAGTVRGLHFQHAPHAEKKIVRCLAGKVYDVLLDLRQGSPTFLQWRGVELSAENDLALLIPEGCAHGFQTLSDDVELLYLHTAHYTPQAEAGVAHDDPRILLAWPLAVTELSERDRSHPRLADDFAGITL